MAWHKQFQLPKLCSVLNRASIPHYRTIAPCKGVQDSLEFWIPRRQFRILCQWNLDSGFISLDSRFHWSVLRTPKPGIPDSTSKNFPDSLTSSENYMVEAGSRSFKTKTISTLLSIGLESVRKPYWIRLPFTHKNGDFGTFSLTEGSYVALISRGSLCHTLVYCEQVFGP